MRQGGAGILRSGRSDARTALGFAFAQADTAQRTAGGGQDQGATDRVIPPAGPVRHASQTDYIEDEDDPPRNQSGAALPTAGAGHPFKAETEGPTDLGPDFGHGQARESMPPKVLEPLPTGGGATHLHIEQRSPPGEPLEPLGGRSNPRARARLRRGSCQQPSPASKAACHHPEPSSRSPRPEPPPRAAAPRAAQGPRDVPRPAPARRRHRSAAFSPPADPPGTRTPDPRENGWPTSQRTPQANRFGREQGLTRRNPAKPAAYPIPRLGQDQSAQGPVPGPLTARLAPAGRAGERYRHQSGR